jgi:hypothetical protein
MGIVPNHRTAVAEDNIGHINRPSWIKSVPVLVNDHINACVHRISLVLGGLLGKNEFPDFPF